MRIAAAVRTAAGAADPRKQFAENNIPGLVAQARLLPNQVHGRLGVPGENSVLLPNYADNNGDDNVNINDLLFILSNWGPCP